MSSRSCNGCRQGDGAVAEKCGRLGFGVEVTENLAQVRILHQVDHRRMTAWREYPDVVLQPLGDH
jgi:hypothetical protein